MRRLGLERCSTVGMEGRGAWGDGECGTPGTMVEVNAASSSQAHCSQSEDGRESCTGCLLGAPSLALRLQPRCRRVVCGPLLPVPQLRGCHFRSGLCSLSELLNPEKEPKVTTFAFHSGLRFRC